MQPTLNAGPMFLLQQACMHRGSKVLATVFSLQHKTATQQGTTLLLHEGATIFGHLQPATLYHDVLHEMKNCLHQGIHQFLKYQVGDLQTEVFLEQLQPTVRLVVGGAGNDVIPLVNMAQMLGWDTMVLDGRPAYAKGERFASGCQVILSRPADLLHQIKPDSRTAIVMMSHNYNYDKGMLQVLVGQTEVPYIGMLGPKKKLQQMLNDFSEAGMEMHQDKLVHVYGPAGLEIGAETPEEIAISIIAEIQAVMSKAPGGMLRNKQDVIHIRGGHAIHVKKIDA